MKKLRRKNYELVNSLGRTTPSAMLIIIIVAVAAMAAVTLWTMRTQTELDENTIDSGAKTSATVGTTLSLAAVKTNIKVGENVDVIVKLGTDQQIAGMDVIVTYDKTLLSPQVINTKGANNAAKYLAANNSFIDNFNFYADSGGQIIFSALVDPQRKQTGGGDVTTMRFKALKKGTATLTFVHEKDNTRDTNVASSSAPGKDILTRIVPLTLEIQ